MKKKKIPNKFDSNNKLHVGISESYRNILSILNQFMKVYYSPLSEQNIYVMLG